MGAAPIQKDGGRSSPWWVVGWLATHLMWVSGWRSHPHRAEVGLDDLCLHGIPRAADVVPVPPAELMAWVDVGRQRPTLVVVGAAPADRVSGSHVVNGRPGMGSTRRDDQLSTYRIPDPYLATAICQIGPKLRKDDTMKTVFTHSLLRRPPSLLVRPRST